MNLRSAVALGIFLLGTGQATAAGPGWRRAAEQWLARAYPEKGRWEVVPLDRKQEFPEGAYQVEKVESRGQSKKMMTVWLVPNRETQGPAMAVQVKVLRYQTVVVAGRRLEPGEPLGPADWRCEERSVEGLPRQVITDPKSLGGQRVRKVLVPLEPITWQAVEKNPDLPQGSRVTLRVRGEGVVVSTEVWALQDGNCGDWIEVQCCDSDRRLRARVADSRHVELAQAERR